MAEIGERMSCDRPAVFDEVYEVALNACEGRREDEGDFGNENTGDLKQSSWESGFIALTGVTGEAIDLVVVGAPIDVGEETNVDNAERDSEADEIEPR